jgi:hypothetical protein
MPTLTFFIVLSSESLLTEMSVVSKYKFLVYIFILTFIFPAVSLLMFRKSGFISSLDMEHRAERPIPFLITGIYYALSAFFFEYKLGLNSLPTLLMIAIATTVLCITLISLRFKISAHSTGLSGCIGIVTGLSCAYHSTENLFLLLALLIACGAVMSARLSLAKHSEEEVYAGFGFGFLLNFGIIFVLA